jgi:hypothetical protein
MWKVFSDKANLEITHKCVITYSLIHLDCHCSAHTQRVAVGIKQLAAAAVWQALNNERQVAGSGMAQTMSCGCQAVGAGQRAATS